MLGRREAGRLGGRRGALQVGRVFYAYRFDGAVTSPSGRYAVLYERLGTNGLVLFALPDGREGMPPILSFQAGPLPPLALDAARGRFAVADEKAIHVVNVAAGIESEA